MKFMNRKTGLIAVALIGTLPFSAGASVITYTSQASFLAAVSGTTTLDFEAQNPNGSGSYSFYNTSLTIGGVTFSQPEGRLFVFGESFYQTNGLTSSYLNVNCCAPSGITATFSGLVMGIGMDLGIQNTWNNPSLAVTFTMSNSDIVSTTAPLLIDTTNGMTFFGLTSDTPFTSVQITAPSQGVAIDNFIYATSSNAVPEPSSLALLGIGVCVAGVGAARRRRREKQQAAAA